MRAKVFRHYKDKGEKFAISKYCVEIHAFLGKKKTHLQSYVGKHLSLRGGDRFWGALEGFRGGTQRVNPSKGGNPKIWPILGEGIWFFC